MDKLSQRVQKEIEDMYYRVRAWPIRENTKRQFQIIPITRIAPARSVLLSPPVSCWFGVIQQPAVLPGAKTISNRALGPLDN